MEFLPRNFYIITYGCQMNVHESEKLAGILCAHELCEVENIADADLILLNTCSIRQNAIAKLHGHIGAFKQFKRKNPNLIIGVCGCATQDKAEAELLMSKFPYVDIVFGTHNIHLLWELLQKRKEGKRVLDIWATESKEFYDLPIKRGDEISAYVNIMYGCNNFCSYCIVPYVRGRERSRTAVDIISETRELIDSGCREITLLGQNVNSYCGEYDFAGLLRQINEIYGQFRIRFMTSHPKDFSDNLIAAIAECQKVSKHIHLPVQSGSDSVLKDMNRGYTRAHYLELVRKIRAAIPDAGITSDIITGFPTETDADFDQTLSLTEEAQFERIFAFIYSPRNGTVAAKLSDVTSVEVKTKRIESLLALQRRISEGLARTKIDKVLPALLLKNGEGTTIAVTDYDDTVYVESGKIGKFVKVKITDAQNSRLFGEIISGKE